MKDFDSHEELMRNILSSPLGNIAVEWADSSGMKWSATWLLQECELED